MPNTYTEGEVVRITGLWKTSAQVALDPSTVTFRMKAPSGAITVYVYGTDSQLVRDQVGVYHVDMNLNQAGTWTYRFESTGTGQSAQEGTLVVPPSPFLSP